MRAIGALRGLAVREGSLPNGRAATAWGAASTRRVEPGPQGAPLKLCVNFVKTEVQRTRGQKGLQKLCLQIVRQLGHLLD